MAFKFNAILDFTAVNAKKQIADAGLAFDNLKKSVQAASQNIRDIGAGMKSAAIATAPFTLAAGLATKTAADFEEQLSVVQSVLLATKDEMEPLNAVTKQLGATTAFSAKQAAEGAEFLARAGFNTTEIIGALPGVLDAAAASGVDLATAADVVAGQLGAFGLEASKATEIADALSLTTALTNTDFNQLAEAMKFAAPAAKQAGLSLQETASSMGVLANAGVKGSLAGTALKNALLQLSKPSKDALELFGGRDGMDKAMFRMVDGQKKLLPMESIMSNIALAVKDAKDPLEAVRQATEILGLRGSTAFSSFSSAMQKTTVVSEKNFKQIQAGITATGDSLQVNIGDELPTLTALRLQIAGATGTAKQMASIRLDNLKGQLTLLKSATEGLGIEMGGLFTGPLQSLTTKATDFLSVVVLGFQAAKNGGQATSEQLASLEKNEFKDLISSTIQFAQGFIEGFNQLKKSAVETFNSIKSFLEPILGSSNLTSKELGKIAAKVLLIGAAAAPLLASVVAGLAILGPMLTGLKGVFGLFGNSFLIMKSSLSIVWSILKIAILPVLKFIGVLLTGLSAPVWGIIAGVVALGAVVYYFWDEIKAGAISAFDFIVNAIQPLITVGKFLGGIFIAAFQMIMEKLSPMISFFKLFFSVVWEGAKSVFSGFVGMVVSAFNSVIEFVKPFASTLVEIFKSVGSTIFEYISAPFRGILSLVKGVVSTLAGTFIGKKALSIAGIDASQLQASLDKIPGVESIDKLTRIEAPPKIQQSQEIIASAAKTNEQSLKQQAIVQPPSAKQIGSETGREVQKASGGEQGGGNQQVKVVVEGNFKMRGKDLEAVVTRQKVENTERNGRSISPGEKRRMIQNGATVGGY